MKKILWSLGAIIVLLVAAVLVVPGLINWNDYKADIASQVRELTGRELTIAGDIRISVLPSPALAVNEVSFANAKGASAPVMAQFKTVEVRVALAPLFRGQVKVETIKLVEPLIVLEKLADGKGNWEIETPAARRGKDASAAPKPASKTSTPADAGGLPAITLDNFTIENGTVVYRDPKAGVEETIDGLNARVAAASLSGPFESAGAMTARGFPLSYSVNIGEILHGRTVPLNVRLGLVDGKAELTASGTVLNLDEAPRFKGKVKIDGENLSTLLSALRSGAGLPAQLARKFSLEGAVVASAAGAEVQDLSVRLGDTRAKGDVTVETGEVLRVASRLGIGQIDLDKWLDAGASVAVTAGPKAVAKPTAAEIPAPQAKAKATAGFALPANVSGSLIISVDALSYRGGVIRDAVLNAELSKGLATVSQLSAQFPGGSDLSVFGTIAAVDGAPQFDGEVETTVNDLRGVVAWLGLDIPNVPADRLRKLSLMTKVFAKPSQVQMAGLDLRLDNSRLTGGVTVAVRDRPSFGANIVVDRLNVDSYLPQPAQVGNATPATSKPAKATDPDGKTAGAPTATPNAANPLAGLAILDTFDANVKAHLKTLVYQGAQIKDVVVDGTLYNGSLDLRRLSVAKLAGATVKIKGGLVNLAGLPEAKGLTFDIDIPDLSRVARLAGAGLPMDGKKLGPVSVGGRLDGNLLKPKIETTLNVADATVTVAGIISPLPVGDMIDAKVQARHGDLAELLRQLGVAYRPSGKVGGFDVTTQVSGTPSHFRATDLKGKFGKTAVAGALAIDLTASKPKLTADLTTGAVIIDAYLPAKRRAGLRPVIQPAAWTPTKPDRRPGAGVIRAAASSRASSRWPTDPINLSALQAFDADIALKASLVAFDKYVVEKVDMAAQIADGALGTKTFKGLVFGGTLDGAILVAAGPRNQLQATLKVSGVNVAEALRTVAGEAMADGRMSFDVDVIGSGASVHDIIASLGGRGGFDLADVDAKKAGTGTALAGLFGLLTSLNSIGGSAKNDKARVTGTFTMARGVAVSRDIKLASAYGDGAAAGSVDLPGWAIDMKGEVRLAESFLMQVLKAKVRESRNAVPFEISGPLDAPDVKIDTGAVLGAGLPIPGADALLNKAPKGVGNILRGILGGGQSQPPPPSEPPPVGNQPPPVDSQPQQQKKPSLQEQLLKNLFKL